MNDNLYKKTWNNDVILWSYVLPIDHQLFVRLLLKFYIYKF